MPVVMHGSNGQDIVFPFRPFLHDRVAYHHTDVGGLLGILEMNCLWASSPLALNDSAEMQYGLKVMEDTWASMDKSNAHPAHIPVVESLFQDSLGEALTSSIFVLSATGFRDSLNQWQGYGGRQSYAVGIDTGTFLNAEVRGLPYDPNVGSIPATLPGWYEVLYDDAAQRAACLEALEFVAGSPLHGEVADPCHDVSTALMLLGTLVASIKHPAFRDEREYRYTLANTGSGGDRNTLHFRSSARGLVPYVKLVERDTQNMGFDSRGSLPLREVICGPGSGTESQQLDVHLTKRLLALHGYEDVPVRASSVPYRP
jgi:hypothetical protein